MAVIGQSAGPGLADGGLSYQRVSGQVHRAALALLLTGQADAASSAVDQFLSFSRDQEMDLSECWAAVEHNLPRATALIVPSAGRAGLIFLSNVDSNKQASITAQLVDAACSAQSPQKMTLLQSLLDMPQHRERTALADAGFSELAVLSYMQRHITAGYQAQLSLADRAIDIYHWSDETEPIFKRSILKSYEQTLDCPGLLGLRGIDDIVEGHRSSGVFHPKLWTALQHGDEPVGVMLLNEVPQRTSLELVYLGLAPAWRGKGLARILVNHALSLCAENRANQLILAVDETNDPALKLYRKLGFVQTTRKLALIRSLSQ